ncbi:MAG: DUF2304 domain-containing protein [Acidobacteriaceae bacterium]|nr:DUF2304 domain-containing protein [Acidobacteriaceae bacterium]
MLIQIVLTLVFLSLLLKIVQMHSVGVSFKAVSIILLLAAIYVVLFPEIINRVARIAGVGRGADLMFYLCMAVGVYLLTLLYLRLKDTELRMARLVQHIAVERAIAELPAIHDGSERRDQ